jgi:hypothetical protein
MATRRGILTALALVVGAAAFAGARAGDAASKFKTTAKSVGKEIARESKKVGHAIAETSKDVGRETAKGARKAWYETRDWTTTTSKRVADATVRWWDDAIRSKEVERDRLREENRRLKR